MKQHKHDVSSSTADENATERGKIEAIFGERESEDMVVDVVSADVAVEREAGVQDHVMEGADVAEVRVESLEKIEVVVAQENEAVTGASGSVERETGAQDHVMEDADVAEVRVESLEKVEVVVAQENEAVTGASGSVKRETGAQDHVMEGADVAEVRVENLEKVEAVVVQQNEAVTGASGSVVEEVADGGCVADEETRKETEVLSSLKVPESTEGQVVTEGGLVDEDRAEDSVNNVDVSTNNTENQAGVEQTKNESFESAVEAGNGTAESVKEAADVDSVTSEKPEKDEISGSAKIQDSVAEVDEVSTNEGLARKDETQDGESEDQSKCVNLGACEGDQKNKEESLTVKDSESGKETEVEDSKMDDEPEVDKADQDSSKIPQSSIMASLGLEDVDVVVVDEGLEGKNEEQDPVSVEPSLVNPDEQSILTESVNVETGEVDQKSEVDSTKKDESPSATIKPDEVVACSKVDEVTIAQKEPNSDVQVSTNGGILVENQSINVDALAADCSKDDVVAFTEPESVAVKVEPATIGHDSSDFHVDQGLDADHSNQGNEITTSHIRVPDSTVEVPTTGGQHGVLPASSEFSYEDAHMERAEDVGMDIDEVLGWKDEIPPVQEDEQKVDPTNLSNVEMQETETPVSLQQSCYFHPPENEGEFSVSDLVWGKVRSHPWWPGQIFDPSDASEKAMKYHKKDCFLVAYFGDRTFAWNDSAVLKPFWENFSEIVDHTDSEGFNNAVHCALQEVSRRVELGLTCSCIPHEIYENIKCQIVENSGIKQESSRRHGVDKSASVSSFEPNMLVDYVRLLAKFPHGEGGKMELTIAKAQLSSYGRFKGHRQLAEFQLCGDLLEAEQVIKDETYSEDDSKKRKALDSISDGSDKRPTLQTGPPEQVTVPGPTKLENPDDMLLSQLHLAAQDPMKGYGFVNNIIPFFNNHRATVLSKSSLNSSNDARKRKTSNENQPEDFEFDDDDDVNDSYWTDRIIQNNPEENPLQENQNGGGVHQMVAYEQEKQPVKPTRRSNKKRFFSSNHEIEAKEQSELIERRRKNLATEVLMRFTEGIYFPSEIHLNKMFRRFGPLMESETEVDRQGGRARVVFKKCSDAEVAHSSAGKFNIFGSINVHYELNYTPLISYKPLPLPVAQDPAHAC